MDFEKALWKATGVFAPDYPRQSSNRHTIQKMRNSRSELSSALQGASSGGMPGYYSVYSFPRGHSKNGNIPKVDCIFIDLDVPGDNYDPKNDAVSLDAWKRDMSALLTRARMLARAIIEAGQAEHFRVTLSGHKGLHLYLDFPSIAPNNGSFQQFKNGLKEYGEQVMDWLNTIAGGVSIDRWVDVDASDLGRLGRHPNTIHHGAAYDDTERWCVPITVDELAELRVDDYLRLTQEPRWPDGYERVPSENIGNEVVQNIRNAPKTTATPSRSNSSGSTEYNPERVESYEDEAKDISADDIELLTANYPCIQAFLERDDAWDYGHSSHLMEVNVIGKLVELKVPREVIHEVFSEIPGYSEQKTNEKIDDVLELGYQSFNCEKLASHAPMFCLGKECSVYNRNDDIQK